jgi:truncated hemoglobin YjbI
MHTDPEHGAEEARVSGCWEKLKKFMKQLTSTPRHQQIAAGAESHKQGLK